MAKEPLKNEENEKEESEVSVKPKKKSKLPIIIILIVVMLAALGGGGWYFYSTMTPASAETESENPDDTTGQISDTNIFFDGFEMGIVNLAVSEEYPFMYLKYGFDLECENPKVVAEIGSKLPKLTSKVAAVMSNQNWKEISTQSGRERLGREALKAINSELKSGKCIGIYFTTFVAQ